MMRRIMSQTAKSFSTPNRGGQVPARVFGALIREARRRKKLSQRQLADQLPMSQANLSRIELGDHAPPSDALLEHLANILGIDPQELLRAAGRQPVGETFEALVLDKLDELRTGFGELRESIEHIEQILTDG
jgi:transcriptional regulator with XRE-family HTH domain